MWKVIIGMIVGALVSLGAQSEATVPKDKVNYECKYVAVDAVNCIVSIHTDLPLRKFREKMYDNGEWLMTSILWIDTLENSRAKVTFDRPQLEARGASS